MRNSGTGGLITLLLLLGLGLWFIYDLAWLSSFEYSLSSTWGGCKTEAGIQVCLDAGASWKRSGWVTITQDGETESFRIWRSVFYGTQTHGDVVLTYSSYRLRFTIDGEEEGDD